MVNHEYAKTIYKGSDSHPSGHLSDLPPLYGSKSPSMSMITKPSKLNTSRPSHFTSPTIPIAGPVYSDLSPTATLTRSSQPLSSSASSSTMSKVEAQHDEAACEYKPGENFQGDIEVDNKLPSKSTLDKVADLPLLDKDGKSVPFKSLYWSEVSQGKRVMVLFIRHFFCGNCQEYLRALETSIPQTSLPPDTTIRVVGCGSPSLISSYVELTGCPYPIFADPTKKLYSLLGMTRTLSLGNKDPNYIQHTLMSGAMKSIVQGLKRIGSGDAMQGGDLRQVGGEFLFEVTGSGVPLQNAKTGHADLKKIAVTWCHRMKNTRDHAEIPDLKKALGIDLPVQEEPRRRASQASWRNSGIARSLSNRRQSMSWSRSRKRSRSAGRKGSHDARTIEPVSETAKDSQAVTTESK